MNRWLNLALSLAITVGCFAWTFRNANVPALLASLQAANWLMLVPYLGILLLIHLCRTLRWGNLMSGMEVVPFKPLNEASAIGFMMLLILPFRLGEFARPYLIAERSGIRRSAAMTSVVLERIADGIIIAVMLRVLMLFVPGETPEANRVKWGATLMFLVFGGGLAFLVLARWQHDRVIGVMRAVLTPVSARLADRLVYIVDGFVGALKQLPDWKNLLAFTGFTAAYWGLNGVGMSVLALAFDCQSQGVQVCQPLTLTIFQGFVVLCVLVVGLMIPAAPGSAGTFQAFVQIGLSVFLPGEVVNGAGVAYANVLWAVQILQQVLLGLVFLVLSNSSFSELAGKLSRGGATPEAPPAQ